MWVRSLGQEYPLEVGRVIHCSILARRISWTEAPGRLWSTGSERLGLNWDDSGMACMEPSRVKKLSEAWSLSTWFKWGLGYINKPKMMLVPRTRIKPQRKTVNQLQRGATWPWMKLFSHLSFVEIIFVLKYYVGPCFQVWISNISGKIKKN